MYCTMLSSISGFYLPETSGISPVLTTKIVSKLCQMYPRGKTAPVETTEIDDRSMEENRVQKLTHIYVMNGFFINGINSIQWRKYKFFQKMMLEQTDIHMPKTVNLCLALCTQKLIQNGSWI